MIKAKTNSTGKYILWILIGVFAIFLLWFFSDVVVYILVSAVVAMLGQPLVNLITKIRIKEWRVPRWLAAIVTLIFLWSIIILFLVLFIPMVFDKVEELATLDINVAVDAFRRPLDSIKEFTQHFFATKDDDFSLLNEAKKELKEFFNLDLINNALTSTLSMVGSMLIAVFSITFIAFFFLKEQNLFTNMILALFPKKYESNAKHAMASVTNLLVRYFVGIIGQSLIIMTLVALILMLWGISLETSIFMGFVMGVLNVIPYIGPLMGAVLCIMTGMISPMEGATTMQMVMIVGGSILAVKAVDDFVIQPLLYSNRVKAHPLEIFIVILMAGSVGGILGMLLAIPAYTVIRVFAKEFFNRFRLVQKLTESLNK